MKRLALAAAFASTLFAGLAALAVPAPQPVPRVDFAASEGVMDVRDLMNPYHAQGQAEDGNAAWYSLQATNSSQRPVIRVLQAGQPASGTLRLFPRSTRPQILKVTSFDPGVLIETTYGAHKFSVTIPPGASVALAIQVANAQTPPSLLTWTESALAAHNRQFGIFIAAIAGLIFAAAAIAAGLAVMTGHVPPRWAALTLTLVLLTRLAGTGMFDASLVTHVGGPYGLGALLAGLSLAAGLCLVNAIVPFGETNSGARRWFTRGLIALLVLSFLAYLGVPGAADLTDVVVVVGAVAVAVYLFLRARAGSKPARVAVPSAAVFALVTLAATLATLTGAGDTSVAPDTAGGFAAAAAVLLALAVAAGEGIAVHLHLPHLPHMPHLHRTVPPPPAPPPEPAPRAVSTAVALQAIGASHQGIFDLDFDADMVKLSREAAALLALWESGGRMAHDTWVERVHPDDRAVYHQAVHDYRAQTGLAFRIEFRARSETGRYPWLELRATMMGDAGPANRCLGLLADITLRKEAEAAAMDRTLRDPLTGLGNRVSLMEELEQLGDGLKDAAFALLDIDRFKSIHASLGDAGGDEILSKVADRLKARFDASGRIFRVGGDAFAILVPNGSVEADKIGAELVEACTAAFMQNGRDVFAPASAGVTTGRDARDPRDLLRNAELALIQAKRQGGSCMCVYTSDLDALAPNDSVALEAELRRALQENQLELFYQPIVRLADATVGGFEALLRWRHPAKGLISPVDFIAHSETSGLIVALGRFALERAARDLSQWQRFFPLDPPLFASVNLSRRQLRDPELETFLANLMRMGEISPGTLKLEVTESAVASDREAQAILTRIRALGVGLSIDDFGTGQSSLSQLKDIPFDTLKIDQSFLIRHADAAGQSDGDVVLTSIVSLAHDLKRVVVVEGVETQEDALRMRELGCAFGQGFYFSEPLPMADALNYIARHYKQAAAH
jgi:diguanylate cyclase (GGDEF)-like protein/PAS domain S-box-containing protein